MVKAYDFKCFIRLVRYVHYTDCVCSSSLLFPFGGCSSQISPAGLSCFLDADEGNSYRFTFVRVFWYVNMNLTETVGNKTLLYTLRERAEEKCHFFTHFSYLHIRFFCADGQTTSWYWVLAFARSKFTMSYTVRWVVVVPCFRHKTQCYDPPLRTQDMCIMGLLP